MVKQPKNQSKPAEAATSPEELAASSPEKAETIVHKHEKIKAAASDAPSIEGIAVLGSHPQTVLQAPFDDPSWKIYACSPHNLIIDARDKIHPQFRYLNGGIRPDGGRFRVDEWFEVHLPLPDETRPYSYLEELKKLPLVWMRDGDAARYYKNAQPFPQQVLEDNYGQFFWTSSLAFMLAKALMDCQQQGIKKVAIFGVMQASENEYTYQRPGIQYWIQRLSEAGIEVMCPEESKLFDVQQVKW